MSDFELAIMVCFWYLLLPLNKLQNVHVEKLIKTGNSNSPLLSLLNYNTNTIF